MAPLAILAFALVPGALAPEGATATLDGPVAVPIDLRAGLPAVRVRLDGGEPVWFHVDTYASVEACIDAGLALELDLEVVGEALNGDGSGRVVRRDLVRVDEIVCGSARFAGVTALAMDLSWVPGPDGTPSRGILGFELFRELLLTLDFPAGELRLERGELEPGPHVVTCVADGTPDIALTIGGRELTVGVDTGARSGLFLADVEGLRVDRELEPVRTRGVIGAEEARRVRLADAVTVAGHRHEGVEAIVLPGHGHALIGVPLLRAHVLTVDQRRGLLRLAPPD